MKEWTEDQKDLLRELAQSSLWDAMLLLLERGVDKQAKALLRENLSNGDRGVVLLKARLEGAEALATAVKDIRKELLR